MLRVQRVPRSTWCDRLSWGVHSFTPRLCMLQAVQQLRLHDSTGCDFYLRSRSDPIIEDCTGLRFAPYALEFEGIDTELEAAGLVEAECSDKWCQVKDFKWLRQQQSPNWCILPEEERVQPNTRTLGLI